MRHAIIGWTIALVAAGFASGASGADSASGKGMVPVENKGGGPGEAPFAPKFAYAYASGDGDERRLVLVLTEDEPPRKEWDAAIDRGGAPAAWCSDGKGSYTSFEMSAKGEPKGMDRCGKGGMRSSSGVNVMNDLPSIQVKLAVNDGKRLQGTIVTGDGACSSGNEPPKYCNETGSFKFDTTLAIAPLIDRIWAEGSPNAAELAAAGRGLKVYWDAAGTAKSFDDIAIYLSEGRKAEVERQRKDMPDFVDRMFSRAFVPAHAGPLTVGEGRMLGDDALLATTNTVTRRDTPSTQTCRVLMRREAGAWKVDREECKSK